MKKQTASYWLFLLPSLLGVLVFYIVPFGYSLWYAVTDNIIDQNFVGLKNFAATLSNSLFQGAAFNSAVFMVISVPLGMALALVLSICLQKMKKGRVIATMALLLPLVVPSGTIVYFWKVLFGSNGLVNEFLLRLEFSHPWVSQNQWTLGVLVVIFLWKNVSYNIVLFWSGPQLDTQDLLRADGPGGGGHLEAVLERDLDLPLPHHLCGAPHEHRQQL